MPGPGRIRVHALIDNLGTGGAEMLLPEFAAPAAAAGIDLSVGYLNSRFGRLAADRLRRRGIEPEYVPVTSMVGARSFLRVRRHLAGVGADLVHTHLGTSDCIGTAAARSLGVPSVSTLHAAAWESESPRGQIRLRLSAIARRRCADRIIAVSEGAKAAYLDTGWDVAEHVAVIHNGVAGTPAPGAGRAVREALGIPMDAPVIAMVSSLRPEKAHDVALLALPALRERFPGVRLLVAGDGPERPRLERLLDLVGGAVVMAGHREDVMAVLDAADVLLHPSLTEAFPTVLLEAMAASVPVVATAVGGTPEIVRDGESGLLVAPPPEPSRLAAAVGRVLEDPGLRERLAAGGRARFERSFTLERWVQGTRKLYEELLEAGPCRTPSHAQVPAPAPGHAEPDVP
jgi:glycosyltransferase involved in cell wall biosynthesis